VNLIKKIIFVVDDSKSNLEVISASLSELYTVFTFTSGDRLFKILEKKMPGLILLDVEMPDMDGYEVLKNIKKDPRFANIPVYFITALEDSELESRDLPEGVLGYIKKPIDEHTMHRRIKEAI